MARVEVRRGLVEQQHRRRRAEHPGQAEPLPLAQRQARPRRGRSPCPGRPAARPAPRRNPLHGRRCRGRAADRTDRGCRGTRARHQHRTLRQARPPDPTTPVGRGRRRRRRRPDTAATGRQAEDGVQQRGLARRRWVRSARSPDPVRCRRPARRCAIVAPAARRRCAFPAGRVGSVRRAGRMPCRRRSFRPVRRGTPRRRGAAARTPPAPAASAVRPADSVMSPNTRRRPTLTATSATPSVASSSSTSADRNAMRSVAIAERRWAAPSSAMRPPSRRRGRVPAAWGCLRPGPAAETAAWSSRASDAADRSRVTRPMSTMKSGISGSAISTITADCRS